MLIGSVDTLHLLGVEGIGVQHSDELVYAQQLVEVGMVSHRVDAVQHILLEPWVYLRQPWGVLLEGGEQFLLDGLLDGLGFLMCHSCFIGSVMRSMIRWLTFSRCFP